MFTTINAEKVLFTLIVTLFVVCSFSTIGCNGGTQHLNQHVKTAESAKTRAESARDKALENLKTAESAKARAESARDKALENLKTAESAKTRAESARDKALENLKTAESAKARAESARDKALENLKTAESAKARAESARDKALEQAKVAEEGKKNLEKLVSLVPHAEIKDVRPNLKKKGMDISVTFSIKNRKDIEGWVYVYFYFQNGEKLLNKNKPIFIKEAFTPERVTEIQTVELSMPYANLNVELPDELKFNVHIYDKPTESFLEKEPYSVLFSFDPNKNNPVELIDR